MDDARFAFALARLGLSCERHEFGHSPPFWMVTAGAVYLGNYCPGTRSLYVRRAGVRRVRGWRSAVAAFRVVAQAQGVVR